MSWNDEGYDYEGMTREELVLHCKAYSKALHDLANQVQRLMPKPVV